MSESKKPTAKKKTTKKTKPRKTHEANKVVVDVGVPCPHCKSAHGHRITNTYPNGRRRRICGNCTKPFVSMIE